MRLLSGWEGKSEMHMCTVEVSDKIRINTYVQSAVFSDTVSQFESGKEPVRSQPCTCPIDSICDLKSILLTNQHRKCLLVALIYSYTSIIHQGCCPLKDNSYLSL